MENKEQIEQLQQQITATQSRAFELLSKASSGQEHLTAEINRLKTVLRDLCKMGGIEDNDVSKLASLVQSASASSERKIDDTEDDTSSTDSQKL